MYLFVKIGKVHRTNYTIKITNRTEKILPWKTEQVEQQSDPVRIMYLYEVRKSKNIYIF